ncbi:MAG: flagellar hook assembly protein FlgD [Pseudomonadota bacterium]|nr:flagellar hook assembly protein FlgD [Pseudomonadota bacterium]
MSDISSVSSVLDQYSTGNTTSTSATTEDNELGRDAFLELMVAQLNNQNPLDPMENQEFVAQLAQFSTVEGLDNLNTTVESMSTDFSSYSALQASSLVGQSVIVDGNETGLLLSGGVVSGYAELEDSVTDMILTIEDESGQTLEQFDLGNHEAGSLSIRWDGLNLMVDGEIVDFDLEDLNRQEYYTDEDGEQILDDNGDPIAIPYDSGEYVFSVSGQVGGETQAVGMQMSSTVDSVTLSSSGQVTLNLTGGQQATIDEITQILDE